MERLPMSLWLIILDNVTSSKWRSTLLVLPKYNKGPPPKKCLSLMLLHMKLRCLPVFSFSILLWVTKIGPSSHSSPWDSSSLSFSSEEEAEELHVLVTKNPRYKALYLFKSLNSLGHDCVMNRCVSLCTHENTEYRGNDSKIFGLTTCSSLMAAHHGVGRSMSMLHYDSLLS